MKVGGWVALILGGYAIWNLTQFGLSTATVNFVFDGIDFNGLTDWKINITVQNVGNAGLNLNSMAGTVYANGTSIANISDFKAIQIPGNSEVTIPITLKPSLLSVAASVYNSITNSTSNYDFTVDGNANVNGLIIPFNLDNPVTV